MNKKVKVVFGSREVVREFPQAATIGDVLDSSTQAVLGYGDNIRIVVCGVEQTRCSNAPDVAVAHVVIETKANSKAV